MNLNKNIINRWHNFKKQIEVFLEKSEKEAWLDNIYIIEFQEKKITLGGLNQFFCNWIKENRANTLKDYIFKNFSQIGLKKDFKLFFKIEKNKKENFSLNLSYKFENFVNGDNTSIAYASAISVAESLINNIRSKYNPLFIHGDVGLGKTHLMQSIGNKILEKNKSIKTIYCTSENFTNDVIEGIRKGEITLTKEKYRNCDLLLIDDIQFLEQKIKTQEEFFHTFNELINKGKQIVITADRYPREIKNIEDRLISRFSSGIITKIDKPLLETRVAIIKNEIKTINLLINEDVIFHIAHVIKTNVRDIKAVIKCLEAEKSLLNQKINLDSVRIILKDIFNLDRSPVNINEIIKEVSKKLNIKISDIKSEKRDRNITFARHVAMYISREITDFSYTAIGDYFEKNHASVLQSYKKIKSTIDEDKDLKQLVNSINSIIESNKVTSY